MLSPRAARVPASQTQQVTLEVTRLRRRGIDVVDLGAGEPDFPTPAHIKTAGISAITEDFTRYTPNAGVQELREAVCARYRADYGVPFEPTMSSSRRAASRRSSTRPWRSAARAIR